METATMEQTACGPLPALSVGKTGIMSEMNSTGDTKVEWNKDSPEEVDNARASFDRLTKNNKFAAFRLNRDGSQGGKMTSFDPKAERIVLVPAYAGG
jgi:hypothetical protein